VRLAGVALVALASAALAVAGCTLDARVATIPSDAGAPQFHTLAAGSALPDDATCAALVRRTSREQRPQNTTPNHEVPTSAQLAQLVPLATYGYDPRANALESRITGDFTGTTDEILQWAACKWGFDEDHVRAEAVQSSGWSQAAVTDWTSTLTDCPPDPTTQTLDGGVQCARTYGILLVLWTYHKDAWPMFRDSTAFHVDYVYALRRACLEGWDLTQASRATAAMPYAANDEFGCMGAKFSGQWYDDAAKGYIAAVKGQILGQAWTRPDF
jgi:hypothetical protein